MKGSDHAMGDKFKKNPQAMLGDFCIRDSLPDPFKCVPLTNQMEKLEPQPQVVEALGLVTVKREPSRPSV